MRHTTSMTPACWYAALLLIGAQAALSSASAPASRSLAQSAAGACCTSSGCKSDLDINSCQQQGGRWLQGQTCAQDPCATGTCCAVSTTQNPIPCSTNDPTTCYRFECPEHTFNQDIQAYVFFKGISTTTVCQRLKGACCTRQSDGSRTCKRTGFDQCQAQTGFLQFNYNKTCAEAKCSSRRHGGCCKPMTDDPRAYKDPQQCDTGFELSSCNQLNEDFAPTQACAKVTVTLGGVPTPGTSCSSFTGACCYVNDAGTPTCDDKLSMKKCTALPGFVGFAYSKTCSDSTCAKFGACCDMDPVIQNKAPNCSPGRTPIKCQNSFGPSSKVFIPGAPCSACKVPLKGACCIGSTSGATTCLNNVEYKNCTLQPNYLAFNYGKDCQKDNVDCGAYGACCLTTFQEPPNQKFCVGNKYTPHLTKKLCSQRQATRNKYYDPNDPNAPKGVWTSGVPCPPSDNFNLCP